MEDTLKSVDILERLLGHCHLTELEYQNEEVRKKLANAFLNAPYEQKQRDIETIMTCKDTKLEVSPHNKTILVSLRKFNENDWLLPCYGVIRDEVDDKESLLVFQTLGGTYLDGRESSNIWRFFHLSCSPTCKLVEFFDEETGNYCAYFQAAKKIEEKDIFSIDPRAFYKNASFKFECPCFGETCVTKKFICRMIGCKRKLEPLCSKRNLRRHMKTCNKVTENAKKIPCTEPDCEKSFATPFSLNRHVKEVHTRNADGPMYECEYCGKKYTRLEYLLTHQTKTKKGCYMYNKTE